MAKKSVSVLCALLLVITAFGICPASADDIQGEKPFRINVTVNGSSATERGITWYTAKNEKSLVEISGPGKPVITYDDVFEWEGNFCHKAKITALEPGSEYEYTVGSETVRSEPGVFVTDDGDGKFNFIAIADVQASSEENFEKGADTLRAAFETMPEAEFVINAGDFTNDSTNEEWDLYDKSFAQLNRAATVVPVAGNHDGLGVWHWFENMFNLDTSESVQNLNGVNYSFDYGNAHFAVLNSNDVFSLSLAQLKWLKNDLNSTDKDWKILAVHKSPYTLGKDGKWPDALYLQKALVKVVDECDVDLVLSGHDHQYLRTKPLTGGKVDENGGATYTLLGTAGSKRYEIRSFLADSFMKTENIAAMTVQKDGYGNYWNGKDWNSTRETNVGGCFNTLSIDGGTLTFNSYILADKVTDEDGNRAVTNIDSFTLTKETGKNKATFTSDNTTSEFEFYLGVVPSFGALAVYTFTEWLPKFISIVPEIIHVYRTEDTF